MSTFIFDLDGTLVDTKEDMMDAGNLAFQQLGWQVKLDGFLGFQVAVQGGKSILRHGMRSEGLSIDEGVLKDLYKIYLQNYDKIIDRKSKVYEGVPDTLKKLTDLKHKLGLCTNKPEEQARDLLKKVGLIQFFRDSFIGSDTVGVAKPNPKPLFDAINRLDVGSKEVFFVGDTNTDEQTAIAANVKFVFCKYGHGNLYKIAAGQSAIKKIDAFEELLAISSD